MQEEECWESMSKTLLVFIPDFFSHRWGPNHAADPIVTRWQREEGGQVVSNAETGKQVDTFGNIDTLKSAGAGVCGHSEEGYGGLGHTRGHGRPRGEGPLPDVIF